MWSWWILIGAVPGPPVVAEMHERFGALTASRDAVLQGDLDGARSHAQDLTELGASTGLPDAWRPYLARVNAAAEQLRASKDLAAAAVGVANVAVACAECHDAADGGPKLTNAEAVPPQTWSEGQNMPLHDWAMDWMWLGLLANEDEAWNRGATELDRMPLVPKYEGATPNGMRELEQGVYVLAAKAETVDDPVQRGVLYSQLVTTCAQCHAQHRNATAPRPTEAPR